MLNLIVVLCFMWGAVLGNHLPCKNRGQYPPIIDATDSCWAPGSFTKTDLQWVYPKVAGGVQNINFITDHFLLDPWTQPVLSPMPFRQLTRTSIDWQVGTNQYSDKFYCKGTVRAGCFDLPKVSPFGPNDYDTRWFAEFTSDGTQQTCNQNIFTSNGGNNGQQYTNSVPETANYGNFNKECVCSYDADQCDFIKWVSGRDKPGMSVIPEDDFTGVAGLISMVGKTDRTAGGLQILQDTPLRKIFNITGMTGTGFGVSFRLEVVICGQETLSAPGTIYMTSLILNNPLPGPSVLTVSAATVDSWFTLTFPAPTGENYEWTPEPNGVTQCLMQITGLYQDAGGTIPYTHPRITYDTTSAQSSKKFHDILFDQTVPYLLQDFYVFGETMGGVKASRRIQAEICGSETVSPNLGAAPNFPATTPTYSYDLNDGGGTMDPGLVTVSTVGRWLINSDNCGIVSYDVVGPDMLTISTYASLTAGNDLRIDTTNPTSPYTQTHYIRATTAGGAKGYYAFNIEICGAETVSTSMLTVPFYHYYFGDQGTLANEPDVTQYFSSSNPACPITDYYIDRWDGSSYVLFAANGDNTKVTYVDGGNNHRTHTIDDVSMVNTWAPVDRSDLWVTARTKAGLPSNFNRYNFRVKVCGDETLIYNTSAQTKFVFQKGITIQYIGMNVYRSISDSLCPITGWSLHTSSDGGITFAGWVNNYITMQSGGSLIQVNTATPQTWTVYVKTQTVTNYATRSIFVYDPIEIKVCGNEIISTTYAASGTTPSFFHTPNSGTVDLMPDLDAVFTNNDHPDCPIERYRLMETPSAGNTESSLTLTGTFPNQAVTLTPRINMKRWFYVQAITKSGVRYTQRFEVHICGFEEIVIDSPVVYVYQKGDGVLNLTTEFFGDKIYSTDPQICPITTWNLYNETGLNNGVLMLPDYDLTNFHVKTTYSNHEFFRLEATTDGFITNTLHIEVEVCGDENIVLKPFTPTAVVVNYLQYSGYNRIKTIRPNDIFNSLMSNSRNCPIDRTESELYYEVFDEYTDVPIGVEIYRNLTARYDKKMFEIYVNTTNATNPDLDLLIMVKTKASKPFYFPLNITIRPFPTKVFNRKPYFLEPEGYTFNFTLDHELPRYVMKLNVTEQFDDHNKRLWLNMSNHNLGDLWVKYDLETQEPRQDRVVKQFLSYDAENFTLDVLFQGGPEGLYQYANVIYRFKVSIQDHLGLYSDKTIQLNITVNETWYQAWLRRNWRPPDLPRIIRYPIGRIMRITPLGEVEVEFNKSSEWKPKKFENLDHINKNWLKVYIDPSEDWHIWSAQKINTVNFTWDFREFSQNRMRIKIQFDQPLEVSPKLRYDRLVIFLDDNFKLFDRETSRRALGHSSYQMLMSRPIQKQMIDNRQARDMMKLAYDVRWALSIFFVLFLVMGLVFRSPLDRMIKMILELQFMVNMALVHVTIPANGLIGLVILKPFAEFRFQKEFRSDQSGYKELRYSSEDQMAYFGQRFTFGYDTYNVFFNLGTMGHVIVLFLFYILAVYILLRFTIYLQSSRAKIKFYSQMLERLIYSDLLVLMVCSCLEFGAAVLVSMNDFTWETNSVMNIIFSLVILLGMLISVPRMFQRIDGKRKKGRFTGFDLGTRYGMSLLGFKPQYNKRKNQNLLFLASYILLRVFFLLIVFMISSGWVQIIYLVFLFQAYTAFIVHFRPMHGWWNNTLQIFNLSSVMVCLYHVICFTDLANLPGEYEMGFSLITWIYIYILINMLFAWLEFIKSIYYLLKLWIGHIVAYYWRLFYLNVIKPVLDWLSKWWLRFLAWLRTLCQKLNVWVYILEWIAWLRTLLQREERMKPRVEIVPDADAIIERPPTPPPPPSPPRTPTPPRPPTPTRNELKLIKGVWVKTLVKVTEGAKGKNFLVTETAKKKWTMLGTQRNKGENDGDTSETMSATATSFKPKVIFGDGSEQPQDDVINHRKVDYRQVDGEWQPVDEHQSTNKHNTGDVKNWLDLAIKSRMNKGEKPKEEDEEESEYTYYEESDPGSPKDGGQTPTINIKAKPVFKTRKTSIQPKNLEVIPESDNENINDSPEAKKEEVSKVKPEGLKKKERRWSAFDNALFEMTKKIAHDSKDDKAEFYDPALYFNDTDKEKTAVEINMINEDGEQVSKIVEQNPNAVRSRQLWGKTKDAAGSMDSENSSESD